VLSRLQRIESAVGVAEVEADLDQLEDQADGPDEASDDEEDRAGEGGSQPPSARS
jgi:hypothetical protein